jgi:hypothetical protein
VSRAGRDDLREDLADARVEAAPAWLFWGLTATGLGLIGFGVYGIWIHQGTGILDVRVRQMLTWIIGAVIIHDLCFAPLVLLVGRGLRPVRPRVLRAPLQVALAASALVTLLAFPLVRGYGVRAGAPSRLPLNYSIGYLALLGVIWCSCAVWAWRRRGTTAAGAGHNHRPE